MVSDLLILIHKTTTKNIELVTIKRNKERKKNNRKKARTEWNGFFSYCQFQTSICKYAKNIIRNVRLGLFFRSDSINMVWNWRDTIYWNAHNSYEFRFEYCMWFRLITEIFLILSHCHSHAKILFGYLHISDIIYLFLVLNAKSFFSSFVLMWWRQQIVGFGKRRENKMQMFFLLV